MEVKKDRRIIKLNALIIPGKISESILSKRPNCLTNKYSGIKPPLKNIVNTMIIIKNDRPFNCVLVSG
ncbi:hypothetical protein D3C84_1126850 [compost metagenome]